MTSGGMKTAAPESKARRASDGWGAAGEGEKAEAGDGGRRCWERGRAYSAPSSPPVTTIVASGGYPVAILRVNSTVPTQYSPSNLGLRSGKLDILYGLDIYTRRAGESSVAIT